MLSRVPVRRCGYAAHRRDKRLRMGLCKLSSELHAFAILAKLTKSYPKSLFTGPVSVFNTHNRIYICYF